MKIKTFICLCLYYGIARYLPVSYSRPFGWISKSTRNFLCKQIFLKTGSGINVERLAWFGNGTNIELGDNSGIGINCHIHPNTKIGRDVMMGPNCYMLDSIHRYDRIDVSMREQGCKTYQDYCSVIIEDDVWIGRDVMILNSRTIKKGSIIGARTVLTKDFPEYSVIGGNPSRLLRDRTNTDSSIL